MFWSKKNILLNTPKYGWLLYTGNSNAILKISSTVVDQIKAFKHGELGVFESKTEEILQKHGFLLPISDDLKLQEFRLASKKERLRTYGDMYFTFCPSNSCNFRCSYCFEDESMRCGMMGNETLTSIVDYLRSISCDSSNIRVDLYGGEPLLNVDKIVLFDKKIKKLFHQIEYILITNGYLLTKLNVAKLADIGVSTFQITLDGLKDEHNKRRPHYQNKDSFSTIVTNIGILLEYYKQKNIDCHIHIRMNIDKSNLNNYELLYRYLFKLYGKDCILYPAFVKDCNNPSRPNLLTLKEQSDFLINNYSKNIIPLSMYVFPKPKLAYCAAHYSQMAPIIDCFGNFHKCWQDIVDVSKSFKNVSKNKSHNNIENENIFSDSSDAFLDPVCTTCEFFYICTGGCPKERLSYLKENVKTRPCILQKFNLGKMLEIQYDIALKKGKIGTSKTPC